MLPRSRNKDDSALDLTDSKVCVQAGTTTLLNLADYFRANNMKYEEMKFDKLEDVVKAYDSGKCDTLTADVSQLYALRLNLSKPGDHVILPDMISKEPLAPVVRQRDDDWMMIVKWTLYAMINAEELGVTSKNIDEALKSKKPDVMRLVGTEGTYGEQLGLTKDWAVRIIRHVGNYGEIYERNIGDEVEAEDPARHEPALERRRHPVRAADPVEVFSRHCAKRGDPVTTGGSCAGACDARSASLKLHPWLDWVARPSTGRRPRLGRSCARLRYTRSIPPRPRQLIGVVIGVAEQFLAHARALHEEADVELVGHAHAAMHLHAFLHRERRGRAGAGLCHRDRRTGLFEIAIERLQRLQHRGAGDLDVDIELRRRGAAAPGIRRSACRTACAPSDTSTVRPNTSSLRPTISEATAPRPILSTPSSSAPP